MERLNAIEGRVLASLVEKQLLTPQAYPLTLHALTAACNQSTSREPVMALSDDDVERALEMLKSMRLARFVLPSHGRSVVRYRHVLDEVLGLDAPQLALLAVLELRGPQTIGELRARTDRMAQIESVEHELALLSQATPPLAARLGRRPGQKEERWRSLLGGEALVGADAAPDAAPAGIARHDERGDGRNGAVQLRDAAAPPAAPAADTAAHHAVMTPAGGPDIGALEAAVDALRQDVAALRAELSELRDSLGG